MIRNTAIALLLLTSTLACAGEEEPPLEPAPAFLEHDCAMPIPDGLAAADYRCGTMVMLLDRERPNGPRVRLEVAVLRARGSDVAPDPLLFFGGGPGAATLDGYLQTFSTGALGPFNERRDIIFFDQRGTGRSTPSLECPEYVQASTDVLTTPGTAADDREGLVAGFRACRDRLAREGVPISHHHSSAIVEDAVEILDALGYDGEVNVYGISYGGRLSQVMMRDHPERVRSVISDSGVSPELGSTATWPRSFASSLDAFFAACDASPSCSSDYPNLEELLYSVFATLETSPVEVEITLDGSPATLYITGARALQGVHSVLYDPSLIPLLPAAITSTSEGSTNVLEVLAPTLLEQGDFSDGHQASVLMAEVVAFEALEDVEAEHAMFRPELVAAVGETNGLLYQDLRDFWVVDPRPVIATQPVISDIPILFVAGEFDPAVPPSENEASLPNFENGQLVVFPQHAHGILRGRLPSEPDGPSCGQQVALSFIDAPLSPVDTSCIGTLEPLL